MKHSNSHLSHQPRAISENLVVQELGDETFIYNLITHKAVSLNPTAAFVWNRCDGQTSVSEIAAQLSKKNDQSAGEEIIWLALAQLQEENLIAQSEKLNSHFGGITRREVIRKAALASMIALPLVSSIIAPTAAQAQSGGAAGACTSGCTTIGAVCNCAVGTISCPAGTTVAIGAGLGVCTDATVAAGLLGFGVAAGANGNVCLAAAVCIL